MAKNGHLNEFNEKIIWFIIKLYLLDNASCRNIVDKVLS